MPKVPLAAMMLLPAVTGFTPSRPAVNVTNGTLYLYMLSRVIVLAAALISGVGPVLGQNAGSLPSKDEIFELLSKADEKVVAFQDAVKLVQPDLDTSDPKLSKKYLNAAATTRYLISATKSNGPSAYRLLGILTSLDDLSLNASSAAVVLLTSAIRQQPQIANEVVLLMNSKNACSDISELIFHATMRFVHVEEDLLEKLPK
jgi:hypothetical protein